MPQHRDGWPEISYQYLMHYFWEPGHLLLKKDRVAIDRKVAQAKRRGEKGRIRDIVYDQMQAEEVPLNYLLNVLLRLAPASIRQQCLEPFGIDLSFPGLTSLTLKTPAEYNFRGAHLKTQPDVHLESDTARVFIEVKVNATLTFQQVQKYARLHRKLDDINGPKRAYLLFLVKPHVLTLSDIKRSFDHASSGDALTELLGPEADGITLGSTTWAALAEVLTREMAWRSEQPSESVEMLAVLIGDFLEELKRRELL